MYTEISSLFILRGRRFRQSLGCCCYVLLRQVSGMTSSSTVTTTRIAVGQLCSTDNKWINLQHICECAHEARRQKCRMLFLPENTAFMGTNSQHTIENAEPPLNSDETLILDPSLANTLRDWVLHGSITLPKDAEDDAASTSNQHLPLFPALQEIARVSKLWISACLHVGGAPPSEEGRPRIYNTHIILDDEGALRSVYRKIHLFDLTLPDLILKESASTAPGNQAVVCRGTPLGTLGLSTCYDMRFPELYTKLLQDGGAQVLLMPSAFTVPTGQAHWHVLLRARAIENQCYVIAAAQCGQHNEKRISFGHSLVIDPWGKVLIDVGGEQANVVACCDVDLDLVAQVRMRLPIQQHRENAQYD